MQKFKKFLAGLAVHCILSFVILGAVRVYQSGYNKTHYQQLRMASISVQNEKTEIQVLHKSWEFEKISDNDAIYYLAYFLTDRQLHGWLFLLDFIKFS